MNKQQRLQTTIKNLQNQVQQLKKNKATSLVKSTKRRNNAPLASVPTWGGEGRPLRIHQVERIGTVTANSTAGTFKADSYVINPANSTSFPWLSSIAALFDKYRFIKLKYTYVNNAGANTAGNVSIGVDFDTLDATPSNSIGMSNLAKFKTFAPWKSETLDIPVNRRGNNVWLYTYDSNASANTQVDLKTYNLGNFIVSTEGMAASAIAGYIMVEYDVELLDKNPN